MYSTLNTVTVSDLCSGFYQVLVEDSRGCLGTYSGSGLTSPVEIVAGTPIQSSINTSSGSVINSILCYGDTAAILSVSNPNASYTYDWYVDGQYVSSGTTVTLPAGEVELRASSSPSCYTTSSTYTLYQPSQLNITSSVVSVSCFGGTDGSIDIEAIGGTPTYGYSWSLDGSSITGSTNLASLGSGVYSLNLTDANNCERLFDIEVTEPLALSSSSQVQDVLCNGESDGSALISVSGGISPYAINWQGVDSTALSAGTYDVQISDANSCLSTLLVNVDEPSAIVANFNVNSVPFSATASGGTPNYSYDWLYFGNYQSSGLNFTPTEDGEYTLVVTDANGCEKRVMKEYTSVGISENTELEVLIYPNPAQDHFVITLEGTSTSEEFTYQLLDSRGRVLREENFKNTIVVKRDNLAAGIYIVLLSSESYNLQKKLIFDE